MFCIEIPPRLIQVENRSFLYFQLNSKKPFISSTIPGTIIDNRIDTWRQLMHFAWTILLLHTFQLRRLRPFVLFTHWWRHVFFFITTGSFEFLYCRVLYCTEFIYFLLSSDSGKVDLQPELNREEFLFRKLKKCVIWIH